MDTLKCDEIKPSCYPSSLIVGVSKLSGTCSNIQLDIYLRVPSLLFEQSTYMKVVRRLRYTRALRSRKGLWLIRLDKMDKKNNSDKDYDGDDKHSVTNDNPAQERADIKELRALKKTQVTRKSIGHLCSKKLTCLTVK